MTLFPAQDKLKHVLAGVYMSFLYFPAIFFNISILIPFFVCFAIAAGREIKQKIDKSGTPEIADFLFTMIVPFEILLLCLL